MDFKLDKRKREEANRGVEHEAELELVSDDDGFFLVRPISGKAFYKDLAELHEKQRQRARAPSPGAVTVAKQRTTPY